MTDEESDDEGGEVCGMETPFLQASSLEDLSAVALTDKWGTQARGRACFVWTHRCFIFP